MILLLSTLTFAEPIQNDNNQNTNTTQEQNETTEKTSEKTEPKESETESETEEPKETNISEENIEAGTEQEKQTQEENIESVEVKPLTPEEILHNLYEQWLKIDEETHRMQVQQFLQTGHYVSAKQRLDFLSQFHDGYQVQYLWAFYYELIEELQISVEHFEQLRKKLDNEEKEELDDLQIEVLFRLGVIYDDMKQYEKAQDVFKNVQKMVRRNPVSKHLLHLLIGTSQIHQGRSWRGVRKISKSFPKIPLDESTWIQSRTRNALVLELIRRSEELKFAGVNKKDRKTMINKMGLLKDAEAQVVASIQLGEVEYVLESLIQIIDGYTRLYDEVLAAPAPKELTEQQKEDYKKQTKEQAVVLLKAAHNYASKGVSFAQQTQWDGDSLEEIQQRESALRQELE